MPKILALDPVTRVEGHLAIDTRVDGGRVVDARVAGRMFRGFEQLLVGRHPVDAARITQRICGICHEVHGIAACLALEKLYGIEPPQNALILRELILGLHLVTDHLFHFYQLSLPDYLDFGSLAQYRGNDPRVPRLAGLMRDSAGTFSSAVPADALDDIGLTVEMALAYAEVLAVRKEAGSGLASLGGKVPFCHAILPGGVTTGITSDRLMNYAGALERTAEFVQRCYLPQAIALAEHFPGYFQMGRSHGNFYANGGFSQLGRSLFQPGVRRRGERLPVRFEGIAEDVAASFLEADGTPRPDKPGSYSWVRAMLYDGVPMEVGPLARMALNPDQGFLKLLRRFGEEAPRSSVMARILARAYEAQKLCAYLQELLPSYRLDRPSIAPPDFKAVPTGEGLGMSLAARGALNHQVTAEKGKVTGYRLQVPSAWNFGPTVRGQRGTVETALIGAPVEEGAAAKGLVVGRIVRSFDPCLACAIH